MFGEHNGGKSLNVLPSSPDANICSVTCGSAGISMAIILSHISALVSDKITMPDNLTGLHKRKNATFSIFILFGFFVVVFIVK